MRKNWLGFALVSVLLLFGVSILLSFMALRSRLDSRGIVASVSSSKSAILSLDLTGVILDSSKFVDLLNKYANEDGIKAVVVRINSPGGAVGPSQEIFRELKRVREELKKPVVASCSAVTASGAYYAAVAADKIVTNPGTLMGSIGVIMEFANLEALYGWAKVKRFAITTGPYKDSGSEYRPMRSDEREFFQKLLTEVHGQFKRDVAEGRGLELAQVEKLADGRVFTGATAVHEKMADELGTYEDALRLAWKMAGETGEPQVFKPRKAEGLLRFVLNGGEEDEDARSPVDFVKAIKALRVNLIGQPLYLMPAAGFM